MLANCSVNVNKCNRAGFTLLINAAKNGHIRIVEELLRVANIDVKEINCNGCTALDEALRGGN